MGRVDSRRSRDAVMGLCYNRLVLTHDEVGRMTRKYLSTTGSPSSAAARGRGKRPPQRAPRSRRTLVGIVLATTVAFLVSGVVAGAALAISHQVHDVSRVYDPPSQATRIFASDGQLIASLFRENRQIVPLTEIPPMLRQAVLAIEDDRFFNHKGVDLRGIARALWRNLRQGELAEGGSTITQQLARNVFLTQERSVSRKVSEILLALEIERRLTKEEILERYMNQVYFGQGAYGVEMAARVYFGKSVKSITLPEAALLAGLVRAPSLYTPYRNFPLAKQRQETVLGRMASLGYISTEEAANARRARVTLAPASNAGLAGIRAPYFISYILPKLIETYGEDMIYKGGLRIYTTLNPSLQSAAEKALRAGLESAKKRRLKIGQGAIVSLDPMTGAVRALVGGTDFSQSQFNRAWQARRQPGSAFKVFVYTAAIAAQYPPTKILIDSPVTIQIAGSRPWRPRNYDGRYSGAVSMRRAIEKSLNVPAARMIQELGPDKVVEMAKAMGIESPLSPIYSLALGSLDVTPLEMASAFGTLANGGLRVRPYSITRITDAKGRVIVDNRPQREVGVSPDVAYVMTDILKGVILRGTATAAQIGRPAAGKTGTTDDYRNAWFIGYTPRLSTSVWVGNDDNAPMARVTGGSIPAQIWASFMKVATASHDKEDWQRPEGVVVATVCGGSGRLATQDCPSPRREVFIRGTAPTSYDLTPPPIDPLNGEAGAQPAQLSITAPQDGAAAHPPFVVSGTAASGTMVTIVVTAEGVGGGARMAEVAMQTDLSGRFAYEFRPPYRVAGTRYVITVSALALNGSRIARTITVTDSAPADNSSR
jgi:penicillin-binding protein 1A